MSLECVLGFPHQWPKRIPRTKTVPTHKAVPVATHYPSNVEEARSYVFSFGKHKGLPITKVPRTYLLWLVSNHGPQEGSVYDIAKASARLLLGTA